MAITLYKNGKTMTKSEGGAAYYVRNYGWSLTAPSATPSTSSTQPSAPPQAPTAPPQTSSAPPQDTSHREVWKDGKKTTVLGSEVADYLAKGYTSDYQAPTAPVEPVQTPTEISTEILDTPVTTEDIQAQITSPVAGIQQVFGEDWTPAPIFEQLGLLDENIFGAVKMDGQVWTIGPGGRLETPESYFERFGREITDTAGIAGEINIDQAKKLGINIEADTLLSDVLEGDVLPDSFTLNMTPEQKAQVGNDILAAAEIKYGIPDLRKAKNEATLKLIETISGMWDKFTEAKEEEKEKLKLEEKSKAIADAQTAYTDVKSAYDKTMEGIKNEPIPMNLIYGNQARVRSQQALDLAPLATAIQIAQGNWDRAKEILDDFSDDWKQAQEWNLQAAQMKIDMLGENLTEAQEKSRFEAQNKLDWFREDYNRILSTQDEVKQLSLMYPQAGVLIADSWEDAYKKISPYVQDEADFEQKMRDLDMKLKEKSLRASSGGGGYAPSAAKKLYNELGGEKGTGKTFNEWYNEQSEDSGDDIVGDVAQWEYELGVRPGMTIEEANKIMRESPGDEFYQSLVDFYTKDKDNGLSRKDIEEMDKGNLTAEHIKALDQVYGQGEESRSFWEDLGTVIDWTKTL